MVFKKASLTDKTVIYIRQHVVFFTIIYFTSEGIGMDTMNIGGDLINSLLSKLERDSVVSIEESEWNTAYELLKALEPKEQVG